MSTLLECKSLIKNYGSKVALGGINLNVESGKIVGLLGPNGSGKTTLIKLACGLLKPTAGDILINGKAPDVGSKLSVAYLPERTYLNDWMTAEQLVAFFADFYSNFDASRAKEMLSALGINPKNKLKTMSKGTKEKVQLVLVMSRHADLYLLDEPIGGVDPAARDYILNTILKNYTEKSSIVISTHLISEIEQVLDDVIFINQGQVMLSSSVDDIRDSQGKSVDALFREVFKC